MQAYLSHSASAPQFPARQCDVDGRRLSLARLGQQIVYKEKEKSSPPRTQARRHFHGAPQESAFAPSTKQPPPQGVRRVASHYPENPSPLETSLYKPTQR